MEKIKIKKTDNLFIYSDNSNQDYGIGTINSSNEVYLIDKRQMTATKIPDKYQQTPINIHHYCGGYTDGLIMVSLLGDIDLKYHHNFMSCAGLWGWVDLEFNVAIPIQYAYAENFIGGKAIVCKGNWDIESDETGDKYWCDNEKWGVIGIDGKDLVPCKYDEIYAVDDTKRYYLVHKNGWSEGSYCIFDLEESNEIFELDYDFDFGYMFNECYVDENSIVFIKHLAGEGKNIINVYDLREKKFIIHNREFLVELENGENKIEVNLDGERVIVY